MPKNKVHKVGDRWEYSLWVAPKKFRQLKSRKKESLGDFKKRIELEEMRIHGGTGEMKFNDLFDLWFSSWSKTVSPGHAASVHRLYELHVKPDFGNTLVDSVSPLKLQRFLEKKAAEGYAAEYLSKMRSVFSMPFKFAIVQLNRPGLINPVDVVSIRGMSIKKPRRRRVISEVDLERFFKVAKSSRHYYYFRLLNATGFRPSEGAGIKLKDISSDGIQLERAWTLNGLTNMKNANAHRFFPMTDELREVIDGQRFMLDDQTGEAWLFPTSNGEPSLNALINANNRIAAQTAVWERGGRNGLKKLNLIAPPVEISLYDFRHTFATRSARILPTKTLQYLLGHANISTTLDYYVEIERRDIEHAMRALNNL